MLIRLIRVHPCSILSVHCPNSTAASRDRSNSTRAYGTRPDRPTQAADRERVLGLVLALVVGPGEGHLRAVLVARAIDQVRLAAGVALAAVVAEADRTGPVAGRANSSEPQQRLCDQKSFGSSPRRMIVQSRTIGCQVLPPSVETSIWYFTSGLGGLLDRTWAAAYTATTGSPRGAVSSSVTRGLPNLPSTTWACACGRFGPAEVTRPAGRLEAHLAAVVLQPRQHRRVRLADRGDRQARLLQRFRPRAAAAAGIAAAP